MITVAIVDDHPIVRAGMKSVLEAANDIVVVAEGQNAAEALQIVEQHAPDVLVLDIYLPDMSGIDVTRRLTGQDTSTAILVLTAHDDPRLIFELLENGAVGYVLKDDALEMLANAVRAASCGESWLSPMIASQVVRRAVNQEQPPNAPHETQMPNSDLTPREFEILCLLAEGLDNSAIAEHLTVTKRTIQNHISNIYGKLGVASRVEAMLYAIRHGWAKVPSGDPPADGS
ncbi:MAG: response regulator transcription factor [Anaerolineae bacterium]|nr:response regulator transcription factor [Anaerolineae bacterium]